MAFKENSHLPNVEQIVLLAVNQVRVEDQVAVSSIEVSVRLRVHRDKLQVLNSPHLGTLKSFNNITSQFVELNVCREVSAPMMLQRSLA